MRGKKYDFRITIYGFMVDKDLRMDEARELEARIEGVRDFLRTASSFHPLWVAKVSELHALECKLEQVTCPRVEFSGIEEMRVTNYDFRITN